MSIQYLMWGNERLKSEFHQAVFVDADVDAAMAVFGEDCSVTNTPSGTGASGREDLRRYLAEDVVPHVPADLTFRRVSRTMDQRRYAEETTVSFTHDRELPWLLPGVAPTGLRAEILAMSMVSFRHTSHLGDVQSRITSYRTLWDHAGLLEQLGLAYSDRSATGSGPRVANASR